MMPAVKHFDPVVGIDVHFVQPPGPVTPVPVPHPFIGLVLDLFDYLPVIGSTVLVNGVHRAQAGTGGVALPPHIPIGGVFIKPPDNECEIFMGSSTVAVDGDAAAYMTLPVLSCSDLGILPPPRPGKKPSTRSMVLPTSVALSIPTGPPVLIGGPPTVSLMALGGRAVMAGLVRGLKSLRSLQKSSRRWERLSRRMQQKADDLLAGASDATRNRVRRALCTVTGHPVDVATGKVFTEAVDLRFPGPFPFRWERVWYSTSAHEGPLGHGWHHGYDLALREGDDVVALRLADGRVLGFPVPAENDPVHHDHEAFRLGRTREGFSLMDPEGHEWDFGGVVRRDRSLAPTALRDLHGNEIRFHYDDLGVLGSVEDSVGRVFVVEHDSHGRITALKTLGPNEGDGFVTLVDYRYDQDGNLVRVDLQAGSTLRYGYEGHLLVSETDPLGTTFHFAYDRSGPDARCVRTWGDGPILERMLTYDPAGRWTAVVIAGVRRTYFHEDGLVVSVEPPEPAAPVAPSDPLAIRTGLCEPTSRWLTEPIPRPPRDASGPWAEFDDRGLVARLAPPALDPVVLERNARGEVVRRIRPDGKETTYRHDRWGRVTWRLDPDGREWRWRYDAASRVSEECRPDGSVHRMSWDSRDNLTGHLGPMVEVIGATYEGLDWLTRLGLADGTEVTLEYDGEGRIIRMTGGVARPIDFQRDADGRVVEIRDCDGSVLRVRRQHHRGDLEVVLPDDRTLAVRRDDQGRLVSLRGSDGLVQERGYDALGRLVVAEDGDERLDYTYEGDDLVGVSSGDGEIAFIWEEAGRLVARRSPSGRTIRFGWSPSGLLTEIGWRSGEPIRIERTGEEVRTHFPHGLVDRRRFDAEGRCVLQSLETTSRRPLVRRELRYDAGGNLMEVRDLDGQIWQFSYDLRGRVIAVLGPSGHERRLEWDAGGNLVADSGGGDLEFDRGDRLVRSGGETFRFDEAGRMVARVRPGSEAEETFLYDTLDRLVAWEDGAGRRVTYAYDAMGRRRERVDGAFRDRFVPVGEALLLARPSPDRPGVEGLPREYGLLPESLGCLTLDRGRTRFFLHQDGSAVVREITDSRGRIRWRAWHDPLGRFAASGDVDPGLRLAGQIFDPETGLHHNQVRMFDPSTGRFLTRDPIRILTQAHAYAYAPNPYAWVDPSGLMADGPKRAGPIKKLLLAVGATATMMASAGDLKDASGRGLQGEYAASRKIERDNELKRDLYEDWLDDQLDSEKRIGNALDAEHRALMKEADRKRNGFQIERLRANRDWLSRKRVEGDTDSGFRRMVAATDDINQREARFLEDHARWRAALEVEIAENRLRQLRLEEELDLHRKLWEPPRSLSSC